MPGKETVLQRMIDCGVVAVVRAPSSEELLRVSQAICAGGVDCIEITMTTPNALAVISEVSRELGGRAVVGVGSVTDPDTAQAAIEAGAEFVVGPILNFDVIEMAGRHSKVVVPGAFTPTEILQAWNAGADVVKVFPASVGGPAYFKAVLAPLPQVRLTPTGGVNLKTAGEFIKAGAVFLGVGSALVDKKLVAEGNFPELQKRAEQFVGAVRTARQ